MIGMYIIYLNYLDCNEVVGQTNDKKIAKEISSKLTTQHHIGWYKKSNYAGN